jgi:probable rRNA maturation factor
MKASFTISKIDDINLRKFNVTFKSYKNYIKEILNILLSMSEIQKSPIFSDKISKINFDISFCNNLTIYKINKEYRNKDSITDVITFSLFCDDENSQIYRKTADLGQIIISLERCDEQKQKTFKDELLTLITHGILHLLGFDHLTKKDYDFVVGIQNNVLKRLGNE